MPPFEIEEDGDLISIEELERLNRGYLQATPTAPTPQPAQLPPQAAPLQQPPQMTQPLPVEQGMTPEVMAMVQQAQPRMAMQQQEDPGQDLMSQFLQRKGIEQQTRMDEIGLESQQTRDLLDTKILEGYTRPQLDARTTILDAAMGAAPGLLAAMFLDSGKYGDVIGKSVVEGVGGAFEQRQTSMDDEMLTAQKQASLLANDLQRIDGQQNQLERDSENNEFQLMRSQLFRGQGQAGGAGRGLDKIVNEEDAALLSSQYGVPAEQLVGITFGMAKEIGLGIRSRRSADNTTAGREFMEKKRQQDLDSREIPEYEPDPNNKNGLRPISTAEEKDLKTYARSTREALFLFNEVEQELAANGNAMFGAAGARMAAHYAELFRVYREKGGTGANLTANEKDLVQAALPHLLAGDFMAGAKAVGMGHNPMQFVRDMASIQRRQLDDLMSSYGRVPMKTTAVPGGGSSVAASIAAMSPEQQEARLAELRAKRGA